MYTIYHIPGIKVGCSKRVEARVKEQGHTQYEVLEVCSTIEQASEREIYWQNKLNYGKDNPTKYAHTLSMTTNRNIIQATAKAIKHPNHIAHTNKKSMETLQFDLKGNLIQKWSSARKASKALNIDHSRLTQCCRGYRIKTFKGFIWKYVNP